MCSRRHTLWGPALQSVGFLLLAACSFRARPGAMIDVGLSDGRLFANIRRRRQRHLGVIVCVFVLSPCARTHLTALLSG